MPTGTDEVKWVAASGARGINTVKITLANEQERSYIVRLYFLEPDQIKPGERIFDIALQGRTVFENLDIVKRTGSAKIGFVEEFKEIYAANELTLTMTPSAAAKTEEMIICGIEIIRQNLCSRNSAFHWQKRFQETTAFYSATNQFKVQ